MSSVNVQSIGALERARAFFGKQRQEFISRLESEDPKLARKIKEADTRNSKEILITTSTGNELKSEIKN